MSKYTAFRCPEELLDKAKAKAQRDRRSLSNYLITLIEKDVGVESSQSPASSSANTSSKSRPVSASKQRPQATKTR
jgi:hypothetical protein